MVFFFHKQEFGNAEVGRQPWELDVRMNQIRQRTLILLLAFLGNSIGEHEFSILITAKYICQGENGPPKTFTRIQLNSKCIYLSKVGA